MTPDDTPIPEDDAIARAARRALDTLAGTPARIGSWDDVRAGARRVRQRRVMTAVAACAIVLGAAGTAAAVAGRSDNGGGGSHIAAGASTTTSTSTTASSTTTTTTTAPTPATGCRNGTCGAGGPGAGTTRPTGPILEAQPTDLQGTLTLASTTLVADQKTSYTLTVRNVSDHPVFYAGYPLLGVWIDTGSALTVDTPPSGIREYGFTIAAGESRTFTADFTPVAEMVGTAQVRAALLTNMGLHGDLGTDAFDITGVPAVPVTVLPPGWTPGQPLDPSQGQWSATVSADATQVTVGQQIAVHASVTNTGEQPQNTEGYGSLAIVCRGTAPGRAEQGRFIDPVTLASGEVQTFTIEFAPTASFAGDVTCSFGIAFHGDEDQAGPRSGIESDTVTITVLPEPGATTTTTIPGVTTSTTTP